MIKMQITLPGNVMETLRREAAQCGVTPNILARIRICNLFFGNGEEAGEKSYIVRLEKWKEVEAYVKVKYPGLTVGDFMTKIAISETKRCPPQNALKAEFDRLLSK